MNPPKCIANLRTQPMHYKMNLEIYQTSFVMKEVVLQRSNNDSKNLNNLFYIANLFLRKTLKNDSEINCFRIFLLKLIYSFRNLSKIDILFLIQN